MIPHSAGVSIVSAVSVVSAADTVPLYRPVCADGDGATDTVPVRLSGDGPVSVVMVCEWELVFGQRPYSELVQPASRDQDGLTTVHCPLSTVHYPLSTVQCPPVGPVTGQLTNPDIAYIRHVVVL